MFSKRTRPRSISSQLVLLFTIAATLLLSCGLGIFYWIVVQHAFAEDKAVLADKLSTLSADLKEGGPRMFAEQLKLHRAGEHAAYWIRLLNSNGTTVAETPGIDRVLDAKVFPPAPTSTSISGYTQAYHSGDKLFSLIAVSEENEGNIYTIQLAQDRTSDERVERNFGVLLLVALVGGAIASTAIGFTVAKRSLRPLDEMARLLERIRPSHLNERVTPAGWPRELQPLAVAFDEMLARLENSFTRLSQFSADLAHELRTPVANILGEAQVALTRDRSADEFRETIESTVAECERLSGIVDNLLFVARADAATEPIERQNFEARDVAEKIAAFYGAAAEDRHIEIECAGHAQIFADPVLFERALSNLIDNALRFTPDGGKIKIDIAAHDGHTEIAVIDSGSGIAPEHLPHVFDRFYRADASRSSTGTGLGLALVKSIVDLHGGSVKIQSEIDCGTSVVLSFHNRAP
jgi:two-component system heavy metal sensor histidine kinase CusS